MILRTLAAMIVLLPLDIFVISGAFSTKVPQQPKAGSPDLLPLKPGEGQVLHHSAFSLCYNEEYEQPEWVAYRLTDSMCLCGAEERSDDFREDKDVITRSALPGDYLRSGYDRGHLCPAGDMSWSAAAMSESFLMSNMSPQVPGFNRGIWKRLETAVREWAVRDKELFIVTAGVLSPGLPTIGESRVAVPQFYYKVVLDHHQPGLKAIAFLMPNRGSKDDIFLYAVSVDSVERITGIDFFPSLPDDEETVLESGADPAAWH